MRPSKEIRGEAYALLKPFAGRVIGSLALLYLALAAIGVVLAFVVFALDPQVDILQLAKPATPAGHLLNLIYNLFMLLVGGITTFGAAAVILAAARGRRDRLLGAAFGGFAYPLGSTWLEFLIRVFIGLWSLLLIVPGIIAIYRYSQAWFLKVEHPDWSAMHCIGESCLMMKGRKWQLFCLDCSYWIPITFCLLGVFAAEVLVVADLVTLGLLVFALTFALSIVVGVYFQLGRAIYYTELLKETENQI